MSDSARGRHKATLRGRVRGLWRDYHWAFVLALAVSAAGLGLWGFRDHPEVRGGTFWDLLYRTLQLFTLEGSMVLGGANLPLQVARLLAPFVTALTAVLAALALFHKEFQSLRLRFVKDHVVICGSGNPAALLASGFRERVVLLDEEGDGGGAGDDLRDHRAFVLRGDPADTDLLRKARVHKARLLVAVCEDDGKNAEIAARAYELGASRRGKVLSCYVHVVNPRLCELLRELEFGAGGRDPFRLQFFNLYDSGARALFSAFPPFGGAASEEAASSPHMLVVGLGHVGESIVVQAAKSWRDGGGRGRGARLKITALDAEAETKIRLLCARYPKLGECCEIIPLNVTADSPDFHRGTFLPDAGGSDAVTAAYVNLDTDAQSLSAGLTLFQHLRSHDVPVVVCTARDAGLATLLGGLGGRGSYGNLHAFGLLDRACAPELLLRGTNEVLARAIHEDYVRKQRAKGATPETNPSAVPWDDLPESLRSSNRRQADHIAGKLAAVGCGITLLTDWDAELFRFEPEEIEMLARTEHARWVAERQADGWRYDPGPKNVARKTSPYLVDWEMLPGEVKELDRNTVREMPAFLARAGFQIYRGGRRAGEA